MRLTLFRLIIVRLLLLIPATAVVIGLGLTADALLPITLVRPLPNGLGDWIGAGLGYATIYGGLAAAPCLLYALLGTACASLREVGLLARVLVAAAVFSSGSALVVLIDLSGSPNEIPLALQSALAVGLIGIAEGALDSVLVANS